MAEKKAKLKAIPEKKPKVEKPKVEKEKKEKKEKVEPAPKKEKVITKKVAATP